MTLRHLCGFGFGASTFYVESPHTSRARVSMAKVAAQLDLARKERRVADADELEHLAGLAAAAVKWQLPSIPLTCHSELITAWHLLVEDDLKVPVSHEVAFTVKMAREYQSGALWDKWARVMWPLSCDFDKCAAGQADPPDGDASAEWTVELPCCGKWRLSQAEKSDVEQAIDSWSDAVISDNFLAMVVDAGEDQGVHPLVDAIFALLLPYSKFDVAFASADDKVWLENSLFNETMRVLRGLAALLDPQPFVAGAQPDDVEFLMQVGRKKKKQQQKTIVEQPSPSDSQIKRAQTLARILQKANTKGELPWTTRHDDYQQCLGAEATKGRAMLDLMTKAMAVQDIKHDDSDSFVTACEELMQICKTELKVWAASLRSGATAALEALLFGLFERACELHIKRIDDGGDTDSCLRHLTLINSCLVCFTQVAGASLKLQVQEALTEHAERTKSNTLTVALAELSSTQTATPAMVSKALTALLESPGSGAPQALVESRDIVAGVLTRCCLDFTHGLPRNFIAVGC